MEQKLALYLVSSGKRIASRVLLIITLCCSPLCILSLMNEDAEDRWFFLFLPSVLITVALSLRLAWSWQRGRLNNYLDELMPGQRQALVEEFASAQTVPGDLMRLGHTHLFVKGRWEPCAIALLSEIRLEKKADIADEYSIRECFHWALILVLLDGRRITLDSVAHQADLMSAMNADHCYSLYFNTLCLLRQSEKTRQLVRLEPEFTKKIPQSSRKAAAAVRVCGELQPLLNLLLTANPDLPIIIG